MTYSERLRALREDNDLTQADIAKVLGTTYQYYSNYENGKRELPFSRAIILAKFYNVSLDYIAGISQEPQKGEIAKYKRFSKKILDAITELSETEGKRQV